PLDSALLLAADSNNDGLLRAADLYNLSLNADLVTLSACETALGRVSTGDDVVGFTRGFLYAGARSLISSLWQVDDRATRDLMVHFYINLSKMSKDEALRQAQLETKEQYPHPYYWAAFLLTGSAI
ncbi:MAG: CHAT domain-containing protein, partial [Deltaproteobacteria bacterium]|nr:CHAT domain-containing protein [Deltaproteobacteria bacterium]